MKNKHGSTHSQTTLLIPMDASISDSWSFIWICFLQIFPFKLPLSYMSKEYLSNTRTLTYDLTFDVLMLLLLNNLIFILCPRFPGPLFALPYCHQFLAPIKTILSWHHKITFFCRWTFTKSFGTKQAQIIFGLLFTPGQRCCGIYQSTPTIRKHDMFSRPLQRSNVVIEFYHFLV